MKVVDKIFGGVVIGFIIPVIMLLCFLWSSYLLGLDMGGWAVFGLVLGIFIDFVLLRMLVRQMYSFSKLVLIAIFLCYSIGMFGFFMGVPVFNILAGVMAGFYIGRRQRVNGVDFAGFKALLIRTNCFSALVLILICVCSAYLAVKDPYTGANLKGMLSLNFDVTRSMIQLIITAGGIGLVVLQYAASALAGRLAYNIK